MYPAIGFAYPNAAGVLLRACNVARLDLRCIESLSVPSLERIDCGKTPPHDVVALLRARNRYRR